MSKALLQQAIHSLQIGEPAAAKQILEQLIGQRPSDPELHYLLGVTEQSSHRNESALEHYRRVLAIQSDHAHAHYNIGMALANLGRHELSLPHHGAAVRLMPQSPWPRVNRGNSLAANGQFKAALKDYNSALEIAPNLPAALTNKGNVLAALGLMQEAIQCHEQALNYDGSNLGARLNLAAALMQITEFERALQSAEQVLAVAPQLAEAWRIKGIALSELRRYEDALIAVDHAIALAPQQARIIVARGDVLTSMLRYSDALACYEQSTRLQPDYALAWSKQASTLDHLGRLEESRERHTRALTLEPDNPDFHLEFALMLLKAGDFQEGWQHFEYRNSSKVPNKSEPPANYPAWSGGASDNTLLLWGEHGLGDQILYASILPDLTGLPQRKLVAVDHRLHSLFRRSMPGFEFVDLASISEQHGFAEQLRLGSLPRLFRNGLRHFPSKKDEPYLKANMTLSQEISTRIRRHGKLTCGVSWTSERKSFGAHKSLRLRDMLAPLAGLPLHFVDLQYGDTRQEREAVQRAQGIEVQHLDEIDNFRDIDALAALIQACDVVLTTSNTTAHLAAALGKDTLVLLPSGKGLFWYWGEHEGRNLWYPSIKAFGQASCGDWSSPLSRIRDALQQRLVN